MTSLKVPGAGHFCATRSSCTNYQENVRIHE
jgi:hypothetical protein